ncbi:ABC transporter permease [Streptomyces sp. NPDC059092]|uniref:ABC transporter permease n=1 Tax=Streptomyces sp. NPDC059092 TaxID=3346725 RepID=UPI0036759BA9
MSSLGAFRALLSAAVQEAFMYRGRYVVGVLVGLVQISVLFFIWRAIMRDGQSQAGYDWPQMQTYLLLSFLLSLLLSFGTEQRVSASIRDGNVSMDLLKPVHYMTLRVAELTASVLIELLSAGLCLLLAALTVVRAVPPEEGSQALLALSLFLAVALKAAIAVTTGVLCFWTTNVIGLIRCRQAVALLLSGSMFPLPMLPDWLQTMAWALPFQGSFHTPMVIYFGRTGTAEAVGLVALQMLWLAALVGATRLLLNHGFRRMDTYGG